MAGLFVHAFSEVVKEKNIVIKAGASSLQLIQGGNYVQLLLKLYGVVLKKFLADKAHGRQCFVFKMLQLEALLLIFGKLRHE